jgi:hypothetical protein
MIRIKGDHIAGGVADFTLEKMSMEQEAQFLQAAKNSGLRETSCKFCGCRLFTRGASDYCPPHRRLS